MKPEDDGQDWIRDVLASLDRPATPDHVVQRIDAAIAAASVPAPREPDAPSVGVPQQSRGPGSASPRSRRRPWLLSAGSVAAALVLVATVGPFGSQPEVPAASQTAETAVADPVPADPATGDAQSVDAVAGVLMASQTSYSRQGLSEQVTAVSRMLAEESEPSDLPAPWSSTDERPAATARGAADCVGALPAPSGRLLYVDRAEYEGQPVLVVAWRASSEVEVYVLAAGCTAADTRVLLRATVDAP